MTSAEAVLSFGDFALAEEIELGLNASMTIDAALIPRTLDGPTIRVAVKLDRQMVDDAKNLKIDIHGLFRMTLQAAVDAIKRDEYGKYDPGPQGTDENLKETILSALGGVPEFGGNESAPEGSDVAISQRIADAAQRAGKRQCFVGGPRNSF